MAMSRLGPYPSFTHTIAYRFFSFYSCPMPRPQNPELRLTFSFKNEFGTVPPIPFGVNQVDLHLALEAGIQELRTKAQLTNDSFLLPQQPGMLSHYNITAGGAALHFLGYPCRNHTTIATSPKFTYTEIFEPIRYSDLVSIFEGVQGLLKIRDQWTKINAGIVRAETSEYGYDSSVIWYNSTKLGLLEMLDAGFEWHSLQGVAIDANFTCEGSVNATRPTAMLK